MNPENVMDEYCFCPTCIYPEISLKKNLREKGLFAEDDTLYLSNQEGAGKSDGRLFHKVLKREQISSVDLHHHGNCLRRG